MSFAAKILIAKEQNDTKYRGVKTQCNANDILCWQIHGIARVVNCGHQPFYLTASHKFYSTLGYPEVTNVGINIYNLPYVSMNRTDILKVGLTSIIPKSSHVIIVFVGIRVEH